MLLNRLSCRLIVKGSDLKGDMTIYSVIMAGGSGARFWPLSRKDRPKQLLNISGSTTMIQATVERLKPLSGSERTIVITGKSHAEEIKKQLPDLPEENIIAEPVGRNTAPCVALAASIVAARDPDATMALFPADHVITKPEALIETINKISLYLEKEPEILATIGINPTYPETGYGYIKMGNGENDIFSVEEFCEKPDDKTAKRYVDDGNYLWNAGMFFWKVSAITENLERYMPTLAKAMAPIMDTIGSDSFNSAMAELYPALPAESIDYGVMEKAGAEGKVIVAACDPGWNDVGSWRSVYDLIPADSDGNRATGELVAIDATGVLSHSDKRTIAIVGVNDVIVIETDDAILVCDKNRAQDVRAITEELKKRGRDNLL